jgi:hypothetical protein
MRRLWILVLLCLPLNLAAESSLPMMKHLLGDREFFEPWGIGIDFFTMKQDYDIKSLDFALPGVILDDPSVLGVENEVQHFDLKLDVWLTPFLQVYGLIGRVDADTLVDLSAAGIFGLPPILPVSYDGTVYGAGFVLVYGTDRWFASVNNTWTKTSLNGDFDSSVSSFTSQPRIGLIFNQWNAYLGAMYLKTDEKHSGAIEIPIPDPSIPSLFIPFNVELESAHKWNTIVGVGYVFSPKATLNFEYGFGVRKHTLFNFTYRF